MVQTFLLFGQNVSTVFNFIFYSVSLRSNHCGHMGYCVTQQ